MCVTKLYHCTLFLFLDADVIPVHSNFISNDIKQISTSNEIIAGNIMYNDKNRLPNLLRWKYGMEKEQKSLKFRKLYPILNVRGANFLIKKELALRK